MTVVEGAVYVVLACRRCSWNTQVTQRCTWSTTRSHAYRTTLRNDSLVGAAATGLLVGTVEACLAVVEACLEVEEGVWGDLEERVAGERVWVAMMRMSVAEVVGMGMAAVAAMVGMGTVVAAQGMVAAVSAVAVGMVMAAVAVRKWRVATNWAARKELLPPPAVEDTRPVGKHACMSAPPWTALPQSPMSAASARC